MTEVLLWEILCLPLTTRALEAAGYIVQRKNLSPKKARRSSAALASRANTRASVTAHSATLRVNIPSASREKTIGILYQIILTNYLTKNGAVKAVPFFCSY